MSKVLLHVVWWNFTNGLGCMLLLSQLKHSQILLNVTFRLLRNYRIFRVGFGLVLDQAVPRGVSHSSWSETLEQWTQPSSQNFWIFIGTFLCEFQGSCLKLYYLYLHQHMHNFNVWLFLTLVMLFLRIIIIIIVVVVIIIIIIII
jgi:hypothetical protein